jgi:hypothetical protein
MRIVFRSAAAVLALSALPAWTAPPSPESHFGFPMGEDRKLIPWDKTVAYFQALDRESDRILVRELGKTTEGRPFIAAWISAPENLRNLERYRQIQQRLADPRKTTQAEAEKLIAEGKTVVMITCSIHSTEVASTLTAVEFAYRILTEDKPKFRAILDNVIFILVPSLNPDGVDIVERWYAKTLGTPYEGTSPPELYHKYTGHDNNRDWYIFSQQETRLAVSQLHNVWRPQIVYDVHQQGPYASRMFVPPWMDPIEPNVDPLIIQMCNAIGAGMAMDLTAAGRKGVAINAIYDLWTPARHYQSFHAGMRILSESASARLATPITVKPEQILQTAPGYHPRQSSWNHLEPWLGGEWRLRDIITDQLIAFESCLFQAAVRREDLLRNFYKVGLNAVKRTRPYAFVLPAEQHDPGSARKLLETLAFGSVEVENAAAPFEAGGKRYPAGSYVIRMQQPYSSFAKALLERQDYPDLRLYPGGPPKRPYDVTAHTLPLLMGVEAVAVNDRFQADLRPAVSFPFRLNRQAPAGALPGSDVDSWREVNRLWTSGAKIWRDPATGDFFRARRDGAAELARPRLGLYRSWVPSMDEGWTRWLLEQFGFQYAPVTNPEILRGRLNERFDVILFPDQAPDVISQGYRDGSMPPEYTGGLGAKGAAELKSFVESGGRLIFLNGSTGYAITGLGLELRNVVQGVSNRDFYSPGSLLNVTLDTRHPFARGLPGQMAIWSEGSPAWRVTREGFRSVANYPASGILASGWLLGEKYLAEQSALVHAQVGRGSMVLFGMRPQYRAQSYQTFKLLFNAIVER